MGIIGFKYNSVYASCSIVNLESPMDIVFKDPDVITDQKLPFTVDQNGQFESYTAYSIFLCYVTAVPQYDFIQPTSRAYTVK